MDKKVHTKNPKTSKNKGIISFYEEKKETFGLNKQEFNSESKNIINTQISSELDFSTASTNYSINTIKIDELINNKVIEKIPTLFKLDFSDEKLNYIFSNEYIDEIYTNLVLDENNSKLCIKKDYMKNQNEINEKMREILVDWIIEIHFQLHLKRKTLFQTIFIIDLYFSNKIVHLVQLQLLGVVALLISFKENEIFCPNMNQFVGLANGFYSKKEILKMEILVLQTLNFDIFTPTADEFYNILSKAFNFNKIQHYFGEYFLDSSLIDYKMIKYKPSTIAVACAYIVMKFFGLNGYKYLYSSKIISGNSTENTIKECARDLCFLVKYLSNSSLRATKLKYSSQELGNVAALCEKQ